jgi:hypothetical protein
MPRCAIAAASCQVERRKSRFVAELARPWPARQAPVRRSKVPKPPGDGRGHDSTPWGSVPIKRALIQILSVSFQH